jgi:hypothetical protein
MPDHEPTGGLGPDFMGKYELHKTPEVDRSVSRLRGHGINVPETKGGRVEAHFGIIERALRMSRGVFVEDVKQDLSREFIINLETEDGAEDTAKIGKLIQGLFDSEKEILRQRGMGAELEEYGDTPKPEDYEKYRRQVYDKKQEQEKTLGNWVDYLGSKEADYYPIWFKYLAIRSLTKMGRRDRDDENYSKRSANTLQPFPDLSREALARTLDAFKKMQSERTLLDFEKIDDYSDDELRILAEVDKAADRGDFPRLYAHFQNEIERERRERGESTAGEWRHFPQGSDPRVLVSTLEGKGTEWCTAGLDVASKQLGNGEFWIYYTYDKDHGPTDPRIAIFLVNGQISEVRGVYGSNQDLELGFVDIAREKYSEFPGSEAYEKKDHDMKLLSGIERKMRAGEDLDREDLIFLYEINSPIEGFGHGSDPRVAELRSQRDPKEDAPIVFDCQPQEIAWSQDQINGNTKVYVGGWNIDVFQKIRNYPQIEHFYESFPDKKIFMQSLETDPSINSVEAAEQALQEKGDYLSDWGRDILEQTEFSQESQKYDLVRFTVAQLGLSGGATTNEIYEKAQELGLELCPAEVGLHLRLQYRGGEWMWIAMKQITGRGGYPRIFDLGTYGDQLGLIGDDADPSGWWTAGLGFVFSSRKVSQES